MIRDSIFISYSHKDSKWLAEVKKHLSILVHNHQLVIWDDSKLVVGGNWRNEIIQSINKCKVAILLVSNDFLASEFIVKQELPRILKAAKKEGVVIFNVVLDECAFHLTELGNFQCFNNPKFPLEELKAPERKRVLVRLTTQLLAVINSIQKPGTGDEDGERNEMLPDFSRILVLACIVLNDAGNSTITHIAAATGLSRKIVKASLDTLLSEACIEKFQLTENKKPSTVWRASAPGKNIFRLFEKRYKNLFQQTT